MTDEKAYLQELTKQLDQTIEKLHKLEQQEPVDNETQQIIQDAVQAEQQLRQNYDIGVRFNILKTQLQSLANKIDAELGSTKQPIINHTHANELPEDETLVYVSLFNAQGNILNSWQKLLEPKALYDHSVNRPIYASQKEIEEMLRNKTNKDQNAYFIITVNKNDIMANEETTTLRDPNGFPLLRLKQGALKKGNIKLFVHNGISYAIDKKTSALIARA